MRKLLMMCGLFMVSTVSSVSANAQEGRGFEISGDYQYVRLNPGNGAPGANCQGGSGSFGAYLAPRIGVIGEFGACKVTGLPSGFTSHELSYLVGPRVYFPTHGRLFPFVQALFGGEQLSAGATGFGSASINAFAAAAGGGADVTLTRHVSLRAIQVDYLYTHFAGTGQNNLRIQSGLVWRFGR
jgi:outer membrane immunogenic protein